MTRGRWARSGPARVALAAVGCALAAAPMVAPLAASAAQPAPVAARPVKALLDEAHAMLKAKATGRPVEVSEQTTEKVRVVANPNGTFTATSTPRPVRVHTQTGWADVDNTLVRQPDGSITPRVAAIAMSFSGGGAGPLVRMGAKGDDMAVTWDGAALPAPTLSGDAATYTDVLPGVDLVVKADIDRFSEVLVVKSAKAAANPKLKALAFSVSGDGMTTERNTKTGLMSLRDRTGAVRFTAAQPIMWDSAAPTGKKSPSHFEPSDGATSTHVPIEVGDRRVVLHPTSASLTGASVTYPVIIDPAWSGGRLAWVPVAKKYPNTTYYGSSDVARVGYESQTGGTWRSFFRMDTSAVNGKRVISASFQTTEVWAWSCGARPVQAWATGGIASNTTWNTQPGWAYLLQEINVAKGYNSSVCPSGGVSFDVTPHVVSSAQGYWGNVTIGLRASNEGDTYGWKKFNNNPTLSIVYDSYPGVPTGIGTTPGSNCAGSSVGNTDVTLLGVPSDPDGGTVTARFQYWNASSSWSQDWTGTSGQQARLTLPKSSLTSGLYAFHVKTVSGGLESSWSSDCYFSVDNTPPPATVKVTSLDYPDYSETGQQGAPAGKLADFVIDATGQSDITAVRVAIDGTPEVPFPLDGAGGKVTVHLPALRTGPHVLHVQTVDAAGNVATASDNHFDFWATPAPSTTNPHDVTGDGFSDVTGVLGQVNKICLYPGNGVGGFAAGSSCSIVTGIGNSEFKPVVVGDWNEDGWTDYLRLGVDKKLYFHAGEGGGGMNAGALPLSYVNSTGQFVDSGVTDYTSIHAAGDFDGDGDVDLLARDPAGALWLIRNGGGGALEGDAMTARTRVGTGWSTYMITSSTDVNADGHPDIVAKDLAGDLWVYPGTGTGFGARFAAGHGWNMFDFLFSPGSMNGNGTPDLFGRTPGGELQWYDGLQPPLTDPIHYPGSPRGNGWSFTWLT